MARQHSAAIFEARHFAAAAGYPQQKKVSRLNALAAIPGLHARLCYHARPAICGGNSYIFADRLHRPATTGAHLFGLEGAIGKAIAMEAHTTKDNTGTGAENRRARRMRTLKKGTIILQGGYSVFDCVIRNLSETGAMLSVGGLGIPSHFHLKYDATVAVHPCTVRWRTENAIGVSFDDVQMAA
jgi:hypothetical protein